MKLEYPKEWFVRSAELEGDAEVGAGVPPNYQTSKKKPNARVGLGQFVALWRRSKGWNAEKLATEVGIGTEDVFEIEDEVQCQPNADVVSKLAGIFGVPSRKLTEHFGLEENRTPILRETATRYGVRNETVTALTETEQQTLDACIAALTSTSE